MLDFLKSVPDMTNTPEITMHEDTKPKVPMAKRIRAYRKDNPSATHKEIATALGSSYQYVYMVLKVKPTPKKKFAEQPAERPISQREVDALKEEIETQQMIIEIQKRQTEKHLAIIEYLEGRVGELNELAYG